MSAPNPSRFYRITFDLPTEQYRVTYVRLVTKSMRGLNCLTASAMRGSRLRSDLSKKPRASSSRIERGQSDIVDEVQRIGAVSFRDEHDPSTPTSLGDSLNDVVHKAMGVVP